MRLNIVKISLLLQLLFILPTVSVQASSKLPSLLKFKAFEIKWGGRPRDPFVAPNGMVWFCGQAGNYIGRLNPETGEQTKFEVPEGTHPHNLVVDKQGKVWYAGNQNAHIGKLDPQTKAITQFEMPPAIRDPHTLVFDQQQNIWFTAQHSNAIGQLNVQSGKVRYVEMSEAGSRPYGIKLDGNGVPWAVLVGTNKLATIDPATFKLSEIDLPRKEARLRRIEIGADNTIWYVDYAKGYLGHYKVKDNSFDEYPIPSDGEAHPYGTAMDSEQRIWIADTGTYPNIIYGFDTKHLHFISRDLVKSGGAIRHMFYHAQSKRSWFGVDSGFIVRINPKK